MKADLQMATTQPMRLTRRTVLRGTALAAASLAAQRVGWADHHHLFKISLAQWSLNRQFFGRGDAQKLDPMDFARIAKEDCGIDAIEYVNQFYFDGMKKQGYLAELKKRSEGHGVKNLMIMCDREGSLGDPDKKKRVTAVRNHIKWLEWAAELDCHSIRVNAASDGKLSYEAQQELAVDGLGRLCDIADTFDLNVIVENHGGLSSHGRWLRGVMEKVNHPRIGTLPDFGNFFIRRPGENQSGMEYDRYLGTYELMPFAKGVSAKSHSFDADGNETQTDYHRILKVVVDAGFRGYVGVEFEGGSNALEGIRLTKALLERVRSELAA